MRRFSVIDAGKSTVGDPAAFDALKAGLAEFPVASPPPRLFRFGAPEKFSLFTRGLVALTPPKYFNDPFEAWAGFSTDHITAEGVVRSLCAESGIFYRALKENNPAAVADRMAAVRKLESLARANPDVWAEHLATCVRSVQHTISEQFGVTCFSAFSDDLLNGPIGIRHWAMYAADHRGVAIEFDGTHAFFAEWCASKWMFPVEYRKTRLLVPLSEFDEWDDAKMWKTFRLWTAMKSEDAWGHESEWRIICPVSSGGTIPATLSEKAANGSQHHYLLLWRQEQSDAERAQSARVVRRIILGVRAEDAQKPVLAAIQAPHLRHVEVWRAKPCFRDFALRLERIG